MQRHAVGAVFYSGGVLLRCVCVLGTIVVCLHLIRGRCMVYIWINSYSWMLMMCSFESLNSWEVTGRGMILRGMIFFTQVGQFSGFTAVCIVMCFFRLAFYEKDFPQNLHLKLVLSSCVHLCLISVETLLNVFVHISQTYGFN